MLKRLFSHSFSFNNCFNPDQGHSGTYSYAWQELHNTIHAHSPIWMDLEKTHMNIGQIYETP